MIYPKVSVVIINWNGENFLRNCLLSIKANTKYPNYDIMVVDNGSKDSSIDFLKSNYPEIKIIKNSINCGFAKANNQAIRASKSEYYFFLNNDTEVIEDWLSESVSLAQSDSRIGIVSSKIFFMDMRPQYIGGRRVNRSSGFMSLSPIKWAILEWASRQDKVMTTRNVQGSAFLARNEVFEIIGLFDEGFFLYAEEGDLCCRARNAGFKVMYNPNSKVKHFKTGTSGNDSFLSYFHRNKSQLRYNLLNYSAMKLLIYPFFIILHLLNALVHRRLSLLLKAYVESIKNIREIWHKRKQRKTGFI